MIVGVAELFSSGKAGAVRERIFGKRDITERAVRVDSALDDALARLHITGVNSERAELDTLGYLFPHWEKTGRIPSGTSLYECNLALTEATRGSGGKLVQVRETEADWRGLRSLDLRFGLGELETHHIVLKQTERADAPIVARREDAAPRVAIVIDDFGYNRSKTTLGFLELEDPITIAVLPQCPHTRRITNEAYAAGKQVIAHIPMQPESYPDANPGDGALLERHTADELRSLTRAVLDEIPHARGANNHMGSRLTTR